MPGRIVIVSGPPGAGKSTAARRLATDETVAAIAEGLAAGRFRLGDAHGG